MASGAKEIKTLEDIYTRLTTINDEKLENKPKKLESLANGVSEKFATIDWTTYYQSWDSFPHAYSFDSPFKVNLMTTTPLTTPSPTSYTTPIKKQSKESPSSNTSFSPQKYFTPTPRKKKMTSSFSGSLDSKNYEKKRIEVGLFLVKHVAPKLKEVGQIKSTYLCLEDDLDSMSEEQKKEYLEALIANINLPSDILSQAKKLTCVSSLCPAIVESYSNKSDADLINFLDNLKKALTVFCQEAKKLKSKNSYLNEDKIKAISDLNNVIPHFSCSYVQVFADEDTQKKLTSFPENVSYSQIKSSCSGNKKLKDLFDLLEKIDLLKNLTHQGDSLMSFSENQSNLKKAASVLWKLVRLPITLIESIGKGVDSVAEPLWKGWKKTESRWLQGLLSLLVLPMRLLQLVFLLLAAPEKLIERYPNWKWPIRLAHVAAWIGLGIMVPPLLAKAGVAIPLVFGEQIEVVSDALALSAESVFWAGATMVGSTARSCLVKVEENICIPKESMDEFQIDGTPDNFFSPATPNSRSRSSSKEDIVSKPSVFSCWSCLWRTPDHFDSSDDVEKNLFETPRKI